MRLGCIVLYRVVARVCGLCTLECACFGLLLVVTSLQFLTPLVLFVERNKAAHQPAVTPNITKRHCIRGRSVDIPPNMKTDSSTNTFHADCSNTHTTLTIIISTNMTEIIINSTNMHVAIAPFLLLSCAFRMCSTPLSTASAEASTF